MSIDFASPGVEIPRDRYGRPLVVPPTGGRAVAYTRCTTYVGCLEDTYNLARWQQRMVAVGLSHRPDLQLAVAAHREDKAKLNALCEEALAAAQASAAATTGTALHALAEQHDRGATLGVIPDSARADIDAYIRATAEFEHLGIEEFVVHDGLKIGGTFDRLVRYQGRVYVADIKTGSIEFGMGKIAMQLAVYAHSVHYDPTSHERRPLEDVDRDRAIIIHLPAGAAKCELVWTNIDAGWEAVQIARAVRSWRARNDLATPFLEVTGEAPAVDDLLEQIRTAQNVDRLTDLWRAHVAEWTTEHTEAAATRKQELSASAA